MPRIVDIIDKSKYAKLIYLDDNSFFKISNKGFYKYKLNKTGNLDNFDEIVQYFIYPAIKYKLASLLAKKDYSSNELYKKLYIYGYSSNFVKPVINKFIYNGYIDDRNYCENLIEMYSKRYGYYKIKEKLYNKGIPTEIIDNCLSEYEADNEKTMIGILDSINFNNLDYYKKRTKAFNKLIYRGFQSDEINDILNKYLSTD